MHTKHNSNAKHIKIKYQNLNSVRKSTHSPHFHCYRTDHMSSQMKAETMTSSTVPLSRPYNTNSVNQQPKNTKVCNHLFTATNMNSVLPLRFFDEKLYLRAINSGFSTSRATSGSGLFTHAFWRVLRKIKNQKKNRKLLNVCDDHR